METRHKSYTTQLKRTFLLTIFFLVLKVNKLNIHLYIIREKGNSLFVWCGPLMDWISNFSSNSCCTFVNLVFSSRFCLRWGCPAPRWRWKCCILRWWRERPCLSVRPPAGPSYPASVGQSQASSAVWNALPFEAEPGGEPRPKRSLIKRTNKKTRCVKLSFLLCSNLKLNTMCKQLLQNVMTYKYLFYCIYSTAVMINDNGLCYLLTFCVTVGDFKCLEQ